MHPKSLRFGCFEKISCWARAENTWWESHLSLKGCSNCDRAPFDTKARLESRSSLSVYTKSVSILPVNVPVSCKSLMMSVGNIPFIQNLGHLLFFVLLYIRLFMLASELLKPLVCSQCHTVDGFALLRPELCAGNKSCLEKFVKVKVFHILNIVYDSFSDVGESRVWFASKNLTPCRMYWNAFLIAQIIAKCHSFPNLYDML